MRIPTSIAVGDALRASLADQMQNDAFLVHARLGSGTTGAVFRATEPDSGRQVLLKALHPDMVASLDVDHLRAVVEALAGLGHHGIPSGMRLVRWRGDLVLVRDLIRGVDLGTIVAGSAPPQKIALQVCAEVAAALDAVKAATGFDHGDLKPSNVFVDLQGDVRVVDFGLARALPGVQDRTLTMFHGSVGFMSPERADNQMSDAADVYSLGLMLAWMLTGEMPLRTSANPARHSRQRDQLVERLKARDVDGEVLDLVRRCASYDPAMRPALRDLARTLVAKAEQTPGPRVSTWAGPLVQALVVQPNEQDYSDVGQSLSAAPVTPPSQPSAVSNGEPVRRIRTGAHELPARGASAGPPRMLAMMGAVFVLLAVAMMAGAIAIATGS